MSIVKVPLTIGYTDNQSEIFADPHRFKTIAKGRRFGFTHGISIYMIEEMRAKTLKCLWGDTVTGNIKRYIARYWEPILRQFPKELYHHDRTNNIVHIGDSYCDFRSADRPENWEGYGYDLVCLNEAGVILKNKYLWGNAVRPMLMDNPQSRAIIGGVPKGKNQFFDLCNQGADPKAPNWKHWTFTSYDNPLLHKSEVDSLVDELRRLGGDNFVKQEIFAEFLDTSEYQYIEGNIIQDAFDRKHPSGTEYGSAKVSGVDFARKRDRCTIVNRQGVLVKDDGIHVFNPGGEKWTVRFARMVVDKCITEFATDHIFIDEGESGGGVIDILESWGYGHLITPVMFGTQADNKELFGNKRFEMYHDLRRWLIEKGSLPNGSMYARDLRMDLESITYGHTDRGKLKLMPKAGLVRSPDVADGLVLTFAGPVVAGDYDMTWQDPCEKTNTTYVR